MGWTPAELWNTSFTDYAAALESFNARAQGVRQVSEADEERALAMVQAERLRDRRDARRARAQERGR